MSEWREDIGQIKEADSLIAESVFSQRAMGRERELSPFEKMDFSRKRMGLREQRERLAQKLGQPPRYPVARAQITGSE